jgi:hypothetical protein
MSSSAPFCVLDPLLNFTAIMYRQNISPIVALALLDELTTHPNWIEQVN